MLIVVIPYEVMGIYLEIVHKYLINSLCWIA